jgi:hypothetical protein
VSELPEAPRSRFAPSPDSLRARALRAEIRSGCAGIVSRQMRSFASAVRQLSRLHAVSLDDSGRIAAASRVPSDRACWLLDVQMLLARVADEVHPKAPRILLGECCGTSWLAIGAATRIDPMMCRAIFYAAVAVMVCDERMYPEMDKAA